MFVTPAYAQATGTPLGPFGDIGMILPFVLIFVIMYFLIIRPQRAQLKKRQEMLSAVRRGDTFEHLTAAIDGALALRTRFLLFRLRHRRPYAEFILRPLE